MVVLKDALLPSPDVQYWKLVVMTILSTVAMAPVLV
jgi:hypothetical protein